MIDLLEAERPQIEITRNRGRQREPVQCQRGLLCRGAARRDGRETAEATAAPDLQPRLLVEQVGEFQGPGARPSRVDSLHMAQGFDLAGLSRDFHRGQRLAVARGLGRAHSGV